MSKTLLTQVDGFTPCIDAIVKEHGIITAAVFGVIWRFCQMKDNTCWASHETIGETIGLSRQAICEHAGKLVKTGYLEIVYNEPGATIHYKDTGKANLSMKLTGGVNETDRGCQPTLQGGVNETDTKKIFKDTNKKLKDTISSVDDKPEPIRVPCDIDGIPDDWKDKPKKKQKHQPDHRYTHIAYSAFYSVTKKRPASILVDEVIKIIGDNPNIEHLRKCYIEWCSRGYNPTSIKWLDWYTNGITGNQNKQDRNAEILKREYEEAINGES
jgi:hypothetical protein